MMKNKAVAWILVALMLAQCVPASAETALGHDRVQLPKHPLVQDAIGLQPDTELTVGNPTQMSGYFSTDLWGTNTSDLDVRALLHGYATIAWTQTQVAAVDGIAMRGVDVRENRDGSRTYTFSVTDGLTYNTGLPLTAEDYAFSLLLTGAPEIRELGGQPRGMDYLVGYEAYTRGERPTISGVRLLPGNAFSIQVSEAYRPYFYGLALLNVQPYPISAIAPGCEVRDDGAGVYIAARADADAMDAAQLGFEPGAFSADMLRVTMLDPVQGYAFNPKVTSGPYQLESYDAALHEARFRVNPRYQGNYEGQRPHIERLVFRQIRNQDMADQLDSGAVGLINKITERAAAASVLDLAGLGAVRTQDYARTGFAFLAFACDRGPTRSVAVRQAIARCIDAGALVEEVIGRDRALTVHGYYGMGQWMLSQTVPGTDGQTAASAMEQYAVGMDLDEARRLLIEDGWTRNAFGEPFAEGEDALRYRDEDGALTPLTINWAKSADTRISDEIQRRLAQSFAALGIGLEVDVMPFSSMLRAYDRQEDSDYNLYFLASNFPYLFDPYYDYHTADAYQGLINTSGLRDEALMKLAGDMRRTEPTDLDGYISKWLAFQARWATQMPMVPLYSNVYMDAHRADLQGYYIAQYPSWALAIPYAYFGDEQ